MNLSKVGRGRCVKILRLKLAYYNKSESGAVLSSDHLPSAVFTCAFLGASCLHTNDSLLDHWINPLMCILIIGVYYLTIRGRIHNPWVTPKTYHQFRHLFLVPSFKLILSKFISLQLEENFSPQKSITARIRLGPAFSK